MEPKLPSIIAQLQSERDRVDEEIAEITALIKDRDRAETELARIDAAIAALSGKEDERASVEPHIEQPVVEHKNGNGGDAPTTIDYDGALARLVKFLGAKKKPVGAKAIHNRIAARGSRATTTYGLLKKAVARGIVKRSGTRGDYGFELAR